MTRLSTRERKAILLVELYQRQHGHSPSWTTLARTLGVDRLDLFQLLSGLKRHGAITFTEAPGSLSVTHRGLSAAIGAERVPRIGRAS